MFPTCKLLTVLSSRHSDSIRKGWEILCVVSVTFPPSKDLETYLHRFVQQHFNQEKNQLDILSRYVSAKLVRICSRGARGKVLSAAEIERAKASGLRVIGRLSKLTHLHRKPLLSLLYLVNRWMSLWIYRKITLHS